MVNRELREWLGLTLADLVVYLAIAAVAAMFFIKDSTADAVLAATGVVFALAACPLGMKRIPDVSRFTNAAKLVSYPVCALLTVGAIIVHYVWFSS